MIARSRDSGGVEESSEDGDCPKGQRLRLVQHEIGQAGETVSLRFRASLIQRDARVFLVS